jgi:hypothetical protein
VDKRRVAAVAVLALFVPLVLIGNAVQLIAHPWFPALELRRMPPDEFGMKMSERRHLADVSLDSIVPWGGGDKELRDTRLPTGRHAFDTKERHHLSSVRDYILGLYVIEAIGLVAIVAGLAFRRARRFTKDVLAAGAVLTVGIAVFCGIYVAVAPVSFLGGFHRVFFRGSSWRFEDTETLRRLFPDAFWSDTALYLGGLVALQAVAILLWQRQAIRRWARTAAHARP